MGSEVEFSTLGDATAPSPSVWADCPKTLLVDKGLGYYAHEEFLGNVTDTSFADGEVLGSGVLTQDADTGAVAPKAGVVGGFATLTTGATDNDSISLFSPPIGTVTRNSGKKFWAEARIELTTLADASLFFGLTTEAGATRDIVADNPSNSAQAGLDTKSLIGFVSVQAASAIATIDAVYRKGTGSIVQVSTNVSQASSLPLAERFTLAAVTPFKLGLRFDGRDKLKFYVNGRLVAVQTVDGTIDQTSNLAVVLAYKSGTAAAKSFSVDWTRYATQLRS